MGGVDGSVLVQEAVTAEIGGNLVEGAEFVVLEAAELGEGEGSGAESVGDDEVGGGPVPEGVAPAATVVRAGLGFGAVFG
jgi:hypothetical protein